MAAQSPVLPADRPFEALERLLGWRPPEDPAAFARDWVAELDRHGVESAVLIASIPGDESAVEGALRAFPERFFGYFMVNPLATGVVGRVEQALAAGMQGICLFPAMQRFALDDRRSIELIEKAAAVAGAVVFVHCGVLSVGIRKKLGLESHFDMRLSDPMAVHAIAMRFPGVTFVIPHFGAGYFREALMVADLCPNVVLDTSSSNGWMRYHCPEITLREIFARALDVAGPRRLLFGTDSSFFPRGWNRPVFESQVTALQSLGVGAEDAAAIFGGNLRRLLAAGQS
ncbi:MAG: amidohydrolase family protein [Bryobacterales bacterium]|nr:amidohydrolase family protein [Bryobacterales bacterium]